MAKFVQIQTCYRGNIEDELINIEDISRIALGPNILCLKPHMEMMNITTASLKNRLINC